MFATIFMTLSIEFKRYAHSAGPKLGGLDDGRAGGGEGFGSDLGESGGDVERSGCPLAPLDSWGYIKGIQGAGGEGGEHVQVLMSGLCSLLPV